MIMISSVYAENIEEVSSITPNVNEVCNGKPYHDMVSRGNGNVYYGGLLSDIYIRYGSCFQCSGCTTVVVTQYDAAFGNAIGKYGIQYNVGYRIGINGMFMYNCRYMGTAGSTLSGFRFRDQ